MSTGFGLCRLLLLVSLLFREDIPLSPRGHASQRKLKPSCRLRCDFPDWVPTEVADLMPGGILGSLSDVRCW